MISSFYAGKFTPSRLTIPENRGKIILTMTYKGGNTMEAGSSGNIPGRSSMQAAMAAL